MNQIINDPKFGEMIYKHRWQKNEKILFLDKEVEITIVAKAYSNSPITENQQNSYIYFKQNESEIIDKIVTTIFKFAQENSFDNVILSSCDDLDKYVIPKTLVFKQDGNAVLLCDCNWDMEHGLGIDINTFDIGSQDMFL